MLEEVTDFVFAPSTYTIIALIELEDEADATKWKLELSVEPLVGADMDTVPATAADVKDTRAVKMKAARRVAFCH